MIKMLVARWGLFVACMAAASGQSVSWRSEIEGGELVIFSDDSYNVLIDGDIVLQSETTSLHTNGKWLFPGDGLTKKSSGPTTGHREHIGDWKGYHFLYEFNSSEGVRSFETTFQVVTGTGLLLCEQYFKDGVDKTNVTDIPPNQQSERLGEFDSSTMPVSFFPSVRVNSSFPLGTVTWSGRFSVFSQADTLRPIGSEGGPYVIYNRKSKGTNNTAVTWGPFDNLKSTILGMNKSTSVSGAGLQGMVTSIPPETIITTCLVFASGVTNSIHQYGSFIRKGLGKANYNKTKSTIGLTTTSLSYWTDNGAFYDWYRWENLTASGTPQDVLIHLHDTFRANNLPVRYTQLDAYWYPFIQQNGNCKINDSVKADVFPKGLQYLADQIGPLLLYSGPTCNNSTYWKENGGQWDATYSIDYNAGWAKGQIANVHPDTSYDFYNSVFQQGRAHHGMAEFEIDFLDFNYLIFPLFLRNHTASEIWLRGMADAAQTNNMTVQYCMTLPSDLLVSANFDSVTNARASQDYSPGYSGSFHIGGSSLLLSAMGLGASKDNFMTMVNESDVSGRKASEPNGELNAMVCSLTSGPVGFSDAIGFTNYTVLWPTTSKSGVLLHASRPLTPLESTFYSGTGAGAGAWHSHSEITHTNWYTVLLTGVGPSYHLSNDDFYPRPSEGSQLLAIPWSSQCRSNSQLGECVVYLNTTFEVIKHGTSTSTYELINVAEYKDEMAFVGEVDKYVHVSPDRFVSISRTPSAITAVAVGTPGETINWGCVVSGTLRVSNSTLKSNTITLKCEK